MRSLLLSTAALAVCAFAATTASAQTPVPADDTPSMTSAGQVFERPVRPATAPDPRAVAGAARVDPSAMLTSVTNSVVNAGGASWTPTLSGMSTGKSDIDQYILESSARHGVDPRLVFSVMNQESGFHGRAVSPKGACGYMQLMPGTARRFGVTDIFDARQNIDAGTKYLRFLLDLFDNDVSLALAGYNAGEFRVIREGYRVPNIRETQNYVRLISARYYGRAGRNISVTYGPSLVDRRLAETIEREALESTDDRGVDTLSNIY